MRQELIHAMLLCAQRKTSCRKAKANPIFSPINRCWRVFLGKENIYYLETGSALDVIGDLHILTSLIARVATAFRNTHGAYFNG
jgi:hypothetical protein